MYNGFPVTNTPAIQVWEMSVVPTSGGQRSLTLTDDCAPIQYFRTGGTSNVINVYLPVTPPEGKIIKVVNHRYGASNQQVAVYYPDTGTAGAVQYFALGVGQVIDFCFSRTAYGYGPSAGYQRTGWIMLQQAGSSSAGYYGVSLSDGSNASGIQSMAMGGTGSTASGQASIVAGGISHTASGQYSSVVGGNTNTASGISSAVAASASSTASGSNSFIAAGSGHIADQSNTAVIGGASGTSRFISGRTVFPSCSNPITTSSGINQFSFLIVARQTTDATVTVLTSNVSAAGTNNTLVLPNNSAYYVSGSCIANVTGGGNTKAWSFEAAIKRGANAASTAIVGAVIKNVVAADAGAATWDITISADTTNGALQVQVTGQAATTIRWVCGLNSTEVSF